MAKYKKKQEPDLSFYYRTYRVLEEYRTKKLIQYSIVFCVFIIVEILFLVIKSNDDFINLMTNIVSGILLVSTMYMIYNIFNMKYKYLEINSKGVRYKSLLKDIFIEIDKLDGYRYIKVEYFGNLLEIRDYKNKSIYLIADNFQSVKILDYLKIVTFDFVSQDKINLEKEVKFEKEEYIENLTLEKNIERQSAEKLLSKLKNLTTNINIIITLFALYLLLYGKPYILLVNTSYLLLIILSLFIIYKKGKVNFSLSFESLLPNLFFSYFMLTFVLLLRFFFDFEDLIDSEKIFLYALFIPILIVSILFYKNKSYKNKAKELFVINLIGIFMIIYISNLSAIAFYNCYYDDSNGRKYKVKVIDKHENISKIRDRYLYFDNIIEGYHFESTRVGHNTFYKTEIGDSVNVVINDGLLGFKWYYVEKE